VDASAAGLCKGLQQQALLRVHQHHLGLAETKSGGVKGADVE